jgi:hypothetical protein
MLQGTHVRFPDHAASHQTQLSCYSQDGPPAQWEERLAGYFLLLIAGALVPGLPPQTFDGFLIEARRLRGKTCLRC